MKTFCFPVLCLSSSSSEMKEKKLSDSSKMEAAAAETPLEMQLPCDATASETPFVTRKPEEELEASGKPEVRAWLDLDDVVEASAVTSLASVRINEWEKRTK